MSARSRAAALGGVVLATGLFVMLQALLGALADPGGFYAEGAVPVMGPGEPAPGRSTMHPAAVAALLEEDFVEKAVPETFLYLVVGGQPTVLRGAPLEALLALHGARVIEGTMPATSDEILLGARAAKRLDAEVGSPLSIPASSATDLLLARVVGIVDAPTGLADEILVTRETGERLAGLPSGGAHFVEVVARNVDGFARWLAAPHGGAPLRVDAPLAARAGATLRVALDASAGTIDGSPGVFRATGVVVAIPVPLGNTTWTARADGRAATSFVVRGVAEGIHVVDVRVAPAAPAPGRALTLQARLENFGDAGADATFAASVDGASVGAKDVSLAARANATLSYAVAGLDAGAHEARVGDARRAFDVVAPDDLAAQFRLLPPDQRDLRSSTMREALDDVFGSVALAAGLVGALAFVLFFVGNVALLARLVHEREADLRLLRALGASRWQVRAYALRRTGIAAGLAAIVGVALGFAAAVAYARADLLTLFGHSLPIRLTPEHVGLMLALGLLSTLGATLVAAEARLRRLDRRDPHARRVEGAIDLAEAIA